MQALIQLLAGFIALLLTAALSQFGVDMERSPRPQAEVRRISDCPPPPKPASVQTGRDRC